jgi:acyl carrier protein
MTDVTTELSAPRGIAIREALARHVRQALPTPPAELDWHKPLREYGLDSLMAVSIAADLEDELQIELAPTAFWDHPTLATLAEFLQGLPHHAP